MSKFKKLILISLKLSCSECNLRELCFPHGMNDDDLSNLDAVVDQPKPLHKNDYLYRDGEKTAAIYAVRSGCVKTMTESANGDEQIAVFICLVSYWVWTVLPMVRIPVMPLHWKRPVFVSCHSTSWNHFAIVCPVCRNRCAASWVKKSIMIISCCCCWVR